MYKRISKLIALAIVMIMTFTLSTASVAALTPNEKVLNALNGTPEEQANELFDTLIMSEIPLKYSSAKFDLNKDIIETTTDNKVIFLKNPDKRNGIEAENLGTITFEKAAKIDNRDIDVIISLDKVTLDSIPNIKPENIPEKIQIALFYTEIDDERLWICGFELATPGTDYMYTWDGYQTTDITTTVVYHNDNPQAQPEVVDYNFIYGATDLDFNHSEGLQTIDGFSGKYYHYTDWTLDKYEETINGETQLKFLSHYLENNGMLGGLLSYTMGGVYLQTLNGTFRTRIITHHSGNAYRLFSQYKNFDQNPTKEIVDKKASYKAGDEVTFDVDFTMFSWFDTFETYKKLSLYDKIPEGLDFVKAEMLDADGKAVPGVLTEKDSVVTYQIDGSWLGNTANYNGKNITLRITAKVNGTKTGEIKNVGFADVNGKELVTNEVIITVPTVPYVSGLIWNDADKDGVQDEGEAPVAGVTVTLFDDKDNVIGTAVTDENGVYKFSGLTEGSYTIKADIDYGKYALSDKDKGGDDTKDSDADADVPNKKAVIGSIVVTADKNAEHLDIGLVEIPEETTTAPTETTVTEGTTTKPTTTASTTTTDEATTPVEETTAVTEETTSEEVTTVTATISEAETTAETKPEENPVTGNAPVAMASVTVALAAAMLLIRKKK